MTGQMRLTVARLCGSQEMGVKAWLLTGGRSHNITPSPDKTTDWKDPFPIYQSTIGFYANWTCLERPPVWEDHFFLTSRVVIPDRFDCIYKCRSQRHNPQHLMVFSLKRPILFKTTTYFEWPIFCITSKMVITDRFHCMVIPLETFSNLYKKKLLPYFAEISAPGGDTQNNPNTGSLIM